MVGICYVFVQFISPTTYMFIFPNPLAGTPWFLGACLGRQTGTSDAVLIFVVPHPSSVHSCQFSHPEGKFLQLV